MPAGAQDAYRLLGALTLLGAPIDHPVTRSITLARTWDGRALAAGDFVNLTLSVCAAHLELRVDAPFHDDPVPAGPSGRCWRLWEHEVVELFVLGTGERYTEIEVGPHGHFLGLCLRGRRRVVSEIADLDYAAERHGSRWSGRAALVPADLPAPPWHFNAYAIHGLGEHRHYLAYAPVPGPAPDFHRLECFVPWDVAP